MEKVAASSEETRTCCSSCLLPLIRLHLTLRCRRANPSGSRWIGNALFSFPSSHFLQARDSELLSVSSDLWKERFHNLQRRNTPRSRAETNWSFAGTLYLTLLMGSKETNTNTCSKLCSNVYSHWCRRVRHRSSPGWGRPRCHPSQRAPVSAFFSHYCKMPGPISSSPHDHVHAGRGVCAELACKHVYWPCRSK